MTVHLIWNSGEKNMLEWILIVVEVSICLISLAIYNMYEELLSKYREELKDSFVTEHIKNYSYRSKTYFPVYIKILNVAAFGMCVGYFWYVVYWKALEITKGETELWLLLMVASVLLFAVYPILSGERIEKFCFRKKNPLRDEWIAEAEIHGYVMSSRKIKDRIWYEMKRKICVRIKREHGNYVIIKERV